jgi:hypothetical protein
MRQFDKPKHAFYYLEDRKYGDVGLDVDPGDVGHYTQFQANAQVKGTRPIPCRARRSGCRTVKMP